MSSSADATLLPPPLGFVDDDDRLPFDDRGIDHVGPIAVLGAMHRVDQQRASRPDLEEIEEVEGELEEDVNDTLETPALDMFDEDDGDADATQPRPRVPANSDAFLKAR